MEDWEVSVEVFLAGLFWLTGLALVMMHLLFGPDLGELGLLVAGVGAVLTLRRSHLKVSALQREAFELGRDYERGHSPLRSVR